MREVSAAERERIERMPKAELHVHLEGSIRPETVLDLGRRHGIEYPFTDAASAREWFHFRDFPHFIEVYVGICNALLTVEDYERVTYELAEDAHRQNIHYLEVTFAPVSPLNPRTTALPELVLAGMRAGARQAQDDFGVHMQFIVDAVRSRPREDVMAIAEWAVENLGDGLIGLGLGGSEVGYPASIHRDALRFAAERGVRIALHAGETVGPESIWDALECGSERIGHGVTAIHDPELVRHLAERGTILEVSPTSNICLGVARSYETHPFRALYDAGVQVTVNSDDPPMFDTSLTNEYIALATYCDFSVEQLFDLSLRAVHAAFLPAEERSALAERFVAEMSAVDDAAG
jgi:adenosine deaminase